MPNLSTYKHKFQLFNSQGPFVVPSFVPAKIPALTLTFLSAERDTLKHVFHPDFVKSPVPPVFLDTTRYDNLCDLTLSTQILLLDEYTALPVIASFLDRATSESLLRLEYLTIQIKLQITESRLVCPLDWENGAWKELDARLAAVSDTYVTFIVTLYTYKPSGAIKAAIEAATLKVLDEAMDLLDAQFVALDEDERLDISVERYS
ncbi:hypothetical protein ONZ45_g3749 [Pleurotus djamor]|nr:hypothetical protein ONZ45_g3749 [Pleurotus djamor]